MPRLRKTLMNDFLLRLIIAHLVCVGVWNAFGNGQILGWLGDILDRRLPVPFQKPLYTCPPCLASTYGTIMWFLLGGDVILWIPFIIALSGFNRIVASNLLK